MDLEELEITSIKKKQLEKKGINSVEELLKYIPAHYCDFRKQVSLSSINKSACCSITGKVDDIFEGKGHISVFVIDDKSMKRLRVTWFNKKYLSKKLHELYKQRVIVAGNIKYNEEYHLYEVVNPIIFSNEIEKNQIIYPIYSKIPGMSDDYLKGLIKQALSLEYKETYSKKMLNDYKLVSKERMLKGIHTPDNTDDIVKSKRRIVFDDMYYFINELNRTHTGCVDTPYIVKKVDKVREYIKNLPYEATADQKETVNAIVKKMRTGKRVNSLIQGDVGCGKTLICFCIMIALSENGFQSVLMAPTAVLAKQHYLELKKKAEPLGLKVCLLCSDLKTKEKRNIINGIASGEYDIIIGTHSVISSEVKYKSLGLTIVDEEHKFGVMQRELLKKKADDGVHSLSMSATPIPRTLAMTIYGNEVDVYNIKTLPNGRKPVKTSVSNNDDEIFNLIRKEILNGHQAYIVCPLIEDSDSELMTDVESVESAEKIAHKYLDDIPNLKIGIINGKMKQDEIDEEISRFSRNEYQVIISTTIIEVGVNVPNATIICIRDAERFGLSGLHQLRGRVGRSNLQSYCILKSNDIYNPRLSVMCQTTDGFEIANKDLELRGTGDFIGTKQSGQDKYVMLMIAYPKLYQSIVEYIKRNEV